MANPEKPKAVAPDAQEGLETAVPDGDAVADHVKELRVIQSALGEVDRRLELASIRALTLTAPAAPYPGALKLDSARQALMKSRKDLAEAYEGLTASEDQWQHQRE